MVDSAATHRAAAVDKPATTDSATGDQPSETEEEPAKEDRQEMIAAASIKRFRTTSGELLPKLTLLNLKIARENFACIARVAIQDAVRELMFNRERMQARCVEHAAATNCCLEKHTPHRLREEQSAVKPRSHEASGNSRTFGDGVFSGVSHGLQTFFI